MEAVPQGRTVVAHNPLVVCVETTTEELVVAARTIAEKLNRAKGPVTVLFPLQGLDEYDIPGGNYYIPEGRKAMLATFKEYLDPRIKLVELDMHMNDQVFSEAAVAIFDEMMKTHGSPFSK